MLDWLKEILEKVWDYAKCWQVIDPFEGGVRLRAGKHIRSGLFKRFGYMSGAALGPGFHWKIPFIDSILVSSVVPTTIDLSEQTVTTRDERQLVIEATVKYEVDDVVKLLLEVKSAADALADMAKGIIRREAVQSVWPDVNGEDFEKTINRKIKLEAKMWGIKVHTVSIVSMAEMLSVRLLQTNSWKETDKVKE